MVHLQTMQHNNSPMEYFESSILVKKINRPVIQLIGSFPCMQEVRDQIPAL